MRDSKLSIIYPIFLLLVSFPLIHAWFPLSQRIIILTIPVLLCSFLFNVNAFKSVYVIPVLLYMLFLFFCNDRNIYIKSITMLDIAYLSSGYLISYYLLHKKNSRIFIQILFVAFCFISVTCLVSIIACIIEPGAVRANVTRELYEAPPMVILMRRYGLSDYLFPHALPILIPGVVKFIKDPQILPKRKIWLKLFLILIIVFEWYAESATGLILSLFSLLASFSIKFQGKHNIRNIVILTFSAIILTSESIMVPLIDLVIQIAPESYIQKLIDFQHQLQGMDVQGDAYTRSNLYMDSWGTFLDNILLGCNDINLSIGGHSAILDHLATTGLIGSIPWRSIIVTQVKLVSSHLTKDVRLYYYIGCISFVLMLLLKNMSVYIVWLMFMVYLPTFLLYNQSNTER